MLQLCPPSSPQVPKIPMPWSQLTPPPPNVPPSPPSFRLPAPSKSQGRPVRAVKGSFPGIICCLQSGPGCEGIRSNRVGVQTKIHLGGGKEGPGGPLQVMVLATTHLWTLRWLPPPEMARSGLFPIPWGHCPGISDSPRAAQATEECPPHHKPPFGSHCQDQVQRPPLGAQAGQERIQVWWAPVLRLGTPEDRQLLPLMGLMTLPRKLSGPRTLSFLVVPQTSSWPKELHWMALFGKVNKQWGSPLPLPQSCMWLRSSGASTYLGGCRIHYVGGQSAVLLFFARSSRLSDRLGKIFSPPGVEPQ